jgi:hypothetical protein
MQKDESNQSRALTQIAGAEMSLQNAGTAAQEQEHLGVNQTLSEQEEGNKQLSYNSKDYAIIC